MSNYASVGAVQFPLDAVGLTTSITPVADPARDVIIGLLKQALITELQDAFDAIKTGTKLDGYVVDQTIPFNPEPFLARQVKLDFPFLAVWRAKSTTKERTLAHVEKITDWGLSYVLGEMTILEMGKMYPILNAVESCIITTLENGRHPDYADGYSILGSAGLAEIGTVESTYGHWEVASADGDGIIVPALAMTLRTSEYTSVDEPLNDYLGATIKQHLADGYESITDFMTGDTDYEPDPPVGY